MSPSAGVNYSILEYLSARTGPNLMKSDKTIIKSRPGEGLRIEGVSLFGGLVVRNLQNIDEFKEVIVLGGEKKSRRSPSGRGIQGPPAWSRQNIANSRTQMKGNGCPIMELKCKLFHGIVRFRKNLKPFSQKIENERSRYWKFICHRDHRDHRGIYVQKPQGKGERLRNLF